MAVISGYEKSDRIYRQKLLNMGLTKGETIKFLKKAPLGDPIEIELRGFSLNFKEK